MSDRIRIGTRQSPLAIWQAKLIQDYLESNHCETEIVFVKSEGDINLDVPLYEMGVQGVFTKQLDIALLNKTIDIAVHSLKDVPTWIPEDLKLACVPRRGSVEDILVYKTKVPSIDSTYHLATSSLRRKSQWLYKYGGLHKIDSVRGNINTRIQKLNDSKIWHGMLFAAAGLERINPEVPNKEILDWMIPAPAQGALGVVIRDSDTDIHDKLQVLHCKETFEMVTYERTLLRSLEGGCSLPLGALAQKYGDVIYLKACIADPNGQFKLDLNEEISGEDKLKSVFQLAEKIKVDPTFIKIKKILSNEE